MTSVSFLDPTGPNNKQKLETELGDLLAMIKLVMEESTLSEDAIMKAADAKLIKVEKFMRNGKPAAAVNSMETPHRRGKPRKNRR